MQKIMFATLIALTSLAAHANDQFNVVFKTHGTFEDIKEQVVASIEGQGLKINHSNYIANMLERTGPAVGDTTKVYGNGEQFEFCSARISREMMEADPHAIVMCPYIISVYTLPNDSNTVYVAYHKPPTTTRNKKLAKAFKAVNNLLTGIIKDAIE